MTGAKQVVIRKVVEVCCKDECWDDLKDEHVEQIADVVEEIDFDEILKTLIEERLPEMSHMFTFTQKDA